MRWLSQNAILLFALTLGSAAGSTAELPITVSGSVLNDSRGEGGAEIRLLDSASGAPRQAVAETRSDALGSFSIEMPWRRCEFSESGYLLVIEVAGYAPKVVDLETATCGLRPGSEAVLGGLVLDSGCGVIGSVVEAVDELTRPLAGARVVLWHEDYDRPWETATDETGSFRVSGLLAGADVLGVAHPDKLATRRSIELDCRPGETLQPIELSDGVEIAVEASLEDGRPAAGALFLSAPLPPAGVPASWIAGVSGHADPTGRFRVRVGTLESAWLLLVSDAESIPGGARWLAAAPPPEQTLAVTLLSRHRIRGQVTDGLGDELEGVAVSLSRLGWPKDEVALREVFSEREGRFDSGALEPGTYRLRFLAQGYAPAVEDVTLSARAPGPVVVAVALTGDDTVEGHFEVVDSAGSPIPGPEVDAMSLETLEYIPTCHTGEDGRCAIRGLAKDQRTRISVTHAAHDELSTLVARVDPEISIRIVLPPADWDLLTVRGVVLTTDGESVPGARVALTEPYRHISRHRETRTGRDGSFVLADVPEGGYTLDVRASGWAPRIAPFKAVRGLEPTEVVLEPGALVRGRLVEWNLEQGADYRGVDVIPVEEEADDCVLMVGGAQGLPRLPEGMIEGAQYAVEHVPPGDWALSTGGGYPSWKGRVEVSNTDRELWVDLVKNEPADCSFAAEPPVAAAASGAGAPVLARDQSLVYAFQHSSGVAPPDCLTLELVDPAGRVVADESCADASDTWQPLPRGTYRLRLRYYAEQEWPVVIPSGPQHFVIRPTGSLHVRVLDLEANYTKVRNWLDGLEIELVPIGEDGRQALSATEQTYFPALEEGWWQVRVQTADAAEWNELVEIKEHQERTLTLR